MAVDEVPGDRDSQRSVMNSAKVKRIIRLARKLAAVVDGGGCPLQRAGRKWEKKFVRLAAGFGFTVSEPPAGRAYDIVVDGLRVQCKQRKTLAGGWINICLHARSSRGSSKEAYLLNEFEVLALRCDGIVYIIPSWALESGDGITMKNRFRPSDYTTFINNWDVFRGEGVQRMATQKKFWA
jgi:hypothetical protein